MQSVRCAAVAGVLLGSTGLTVGLTGCTDLAGKPPLPSGVPDQQAVHTAAGARQAYAGAVATFGYVTVNGSPSLGAAGSAVVDGGLLSDELMVNTAGGSPLDYLQTDPSTGLNAEYDVDSRNLPEGGASDHSYSTLQTMRARAAYALGLLAAYDSTEPALRGHLDALTGYAELYLADLFCSGVPLSTLDYTGDFTYEAGSPTDSVYWDAVRQFQRAIPLLADSVRWLNLARVGLGRAWLNLGQYDSAAKAVALVPTSYAYQLPVDWSVGWAPNSWLTGQLNGNGGLSFPGSGFGAMMADREGGVGQPYISSNDPRTAVVPQGRNKFGVPLYFPAKYSANQEVAPLTIASGIEARLIEAEAALNGFSVGSDWLTILNTLRTTGGSTAVPADTIADTLGVTDCANFCGTAYSDDPAQGQPVGGFPVPQGYHLVDSVIIHPVSPEIFQYCASNSAYLPCQGPDSTTTVYVYVKPAQTLYFAGTGGVSGLAPLNDPGTTNAQVNLLFQERAFWLYLDGHRLGDLRRLIRRYGRPLLTVAAMGPYAVPVPQYPSYGPDVEFPVPNTERQINPHFTGCLSRGS